MGVPGGSNYVDGRLLRHLHIVTVDSFEDATLNRIFVAIMDWHFAKGFLEAVTRLSKVSLMMYVKKFIYAHKRTRMNKKE